MYSIFRIFASMYPALCVKNIDRKFGKFITFIEKSHKFHHSNSWSTRHERIIMKFTFSSVNFKKKLKSAHFGPIWAIKGGAAIRGYLSGMTQLVIAHTPKKDPPKSDVNVRQPDFWLKMRFFGPKIAIFGFFELIFRILSKNWVFWKKNCQTSSLTV